MNTCETNSRIILTTGNGITAISCPLSPSTRQTDYVEVFSDGWHQRDEFNYNIDPSRLISVEYIRPDDGDYTFTWLEMSPKPLLGLIGMGNKISKLYLKYFLNKSLSFLIYYRTMCIPLSRIRCMCQSKYIL